MKSLGITLDKLQRLQSQTLPFYHPYIPTGFGTFWLRRNASARPWCNRPCIGCMQRPGPMPSLQRPQVSRLAWEMVKVRPPLADDPCPLSSPAFLTATLPNDQNLVQWLQELSVDPATIQTVSECELAAPPNPPKAAPLSSNYSNFLTAAKMLHTGKALSMRCSHRDGKLRPQRGRLSENSVGS